MHAKQEISKIYEDVMKNSVNTYNSTLKNSKISALKDKTMKEVTLVNPN